MDTTTLNGGEGELELMNVKLSKFTSDPTKLFPDYGDTGHLYFLMDAFNDQTFYDMYMANPPKNSKFVYANTVASEWDQGRKNGGFKNVAIETTEAVGETGKYIKFQKNNVFLHRDGDQTQSGKLSVQALKVLNIGVKNLCSASGQLMRDPGNFDQIIRDTFIKTDINKNGKRKADDGKDNEPILKAFREFLKDKESKVLFHNILNIKRSGDYGQIGAARALTNGKDSKCYIVTFDKLCYLRAKHEKVPCVRIKADGIIDIYHGQFDQVKMLDVLLGSVQAMERKEIVETQNKLELDIVDMPDVKNDFIDTLGAFDEGQGLASEIAQCHNAIVSKIKELIKTHHDTIREIFNFVNSVTVKQMESVIDFTDEKTRVDLKKPKDDKDEKAVQEYSKSVKAYVDMVNHHNRVCEFQNAIEHLRTLTQYHEKNPKQNRDVYRTFKVPIGVPVFGYTDSVFSDIEALEGSGAEEDVKEALAYFGLDILLGAQGIVEQLFKKPLPPLEASLELRRISRAEINGDYTWILRKIYSYIPNVVRGNMKRATDIANCRAVIMVHLEEAIESYARYHERLRELMAFAEANKNHFSVVVSKEEKDKEDRGGNGAKGMGGGDPGGRGSKHPRDDSDEDPNDLMGMDDEELLSTPRQSMYEAMNILIRQGVDQRVIFDENDRGSIVNPLTDEQFNHLWRLTASLHFALHDIKGGLDTINTFVTGKDYTYEIALGCVRGDDVLPFMRFLYFHANLCNIKITVPNPSLQTWPKTDKAALLEQYKAFMPEEYVEGLVTFDPSRPEHKHQNLARALILEQWLKYCVQHNIQEGNEEACQKLFFGIRQPEGDQDTPMGEEAIEDLMNAIGGGSNKSNSFLKDSDTLMKMRASPCKTKRGCGVKTLLTRCSTYYQSTPEVRDMLYRYNAIKLLKRKAGRLSGGRFF